MVYPPTGLRPKYQYQYQYTGLKYKYQYPAFKYQYQLVTVYKLSTSGLMLFVTPNQQCQSTEIKLKKIKWKNYMQSRDVRKQSNKKMN